MSVVTILLFSIALTSTMKLAAAAESKQDIWFRGIYWEVKPYIFKNEKGELDGIVPMIFNRGQHLCVRNKSVKFMEFSKRLPSREAFLKYVHSDEIDKYSNNNMHMVMAPILSDGNLTWEAEKSFISFKLTKTEHIVVIVPRHFIDLPNKILRGILSCQTIFVIAGLLVILLGFIIWLIEKRNNKDFSQSFVKGSGTGFWWSIVSMTTVGYGDIVPKSPLGRFVAVIWLIVGVMIACVMTATMTDVVSGIGDLSVFGKTVAVLENSYEEKVARFDYRANTLPGKSYDEVFEMVRQNKVFAAMVNADVAAWHIDEITDPNNDSPLHIIEKLPANLHLRAIFNTGRQLPMQMKEAIRCMAQQNDEVYTYAREFFQKYCHTETTYIGSLTELVYKNSMVQALLCLACLILVVGTLYDAYVYFIDQKNGKHFCGDVMKFFRGLLGHDENYNDGSDEEKVELTLKS